MRAAVVILVVALVASGSALRRVRRLPKNLWDDPKFATIDEDDSKIVGGGVVSPNSIPHQVSFQRSGSHFCGGSIIDSNSILTAAHCCAVVSPGPTVTIVAGEHSLSVSSSNEQRRQVSSILMHPQYNANTMVNDICILTLSSALTMNSVVRAVTLPAAGSRPSAGSNAVVSGWGGLSEGGAGPDQLHSVTVQIVAHATCNNNYGGDINEATMLCAGAAGKDSCQGDSGGPLTCSGQHCGVVSWGIGCARPNYPGVYARTSNYISWINNNSRMDD